MTIHVDRGRVDGRDSAQDTWTTLSRGKTADAQYVSCTGGSAFDTLNGRLACVASDGSIGCVHARDAGVEVALEPQE